MPSAKLFLAAACLASAASCTPPRPDLAPTLSDTASVYLYVEPEGWGRGRAPVSVSAVSALRRDGGALPLNVALRELGSRTVVRERLLAWGAVPPGAYSGFRIELDRSQGVTVAFPIEASARQGIVAAASLAAVEAPAAEDESSSGAEQPPAFSALAPPKPALTLIGAAADRVAGTVTLFDRVRGRVFAVIPVGAEPSAIAVEPVLRRAFVALRRSDSVEVLDLTSVGRLARVPLIGGDAPESLALTPDGRTLLVANTGSGTVSLVDVESSIERNRVTVGDGPRFVLADPSGRRAYVLNERSNSISVLALPGGNLAATIGVDAGPVRADFSRDGSLLYVVSPSSLYLTVLDVPSLSIVRRIQVGLGATAIRVDPRTGRIYLGRRGLGAVEIFEPNLDLPVDLVRTDGDASFLGLDTEGNALCIGIPMAKEFRLVRLVGKQVVARLDVGGEPSETAFLTSR